MQTTKSTATAALLAAALAGGGSVYVVQPTPYPTLGHAMVAQGYTHSILVAVGARPDLRQLRAANVDAPLAAATW